MKENLKTKLCDSLIKEGKVKEGDVVNHSYTNNRLNDKKRSVESANEMPALTTRPDCLGVAVKRYKNYVTWKDKQGNLNTQCNRASLPNDLALTVACANAGKVVSDVPHTQREESLAIRKLCPVETIKLMGFERKDYEAMREIGMSDMQIFHCCGDSIIVNVLMGIMGEYLGINDYERRIEEYTEQVIKN